MMTHWEADVYAKNLPADQWNARWWQYVRDFQGIEPPADARRRILRCRDQDPHQRHSRYYYSYAIAAGLQIPAHDYIARKILHQPPQSCNYANNKEVGDFLAKIMVKGATEDWRKVLKEATGEDSPRAPWSNITPRSYGRES